MCCDGCRQVQRGIQALQDDRTQLKGTVTSLTNRVHQLESSVQASMQQINALQQLLVGLLTKGQADQAAASAAQAASASPPPAQQPHGSQQQQHGSQQLSHQHDGARHTQAAAHQAPTDPASAASQALLQQLPGNAADVPVMQVAAALQMISANAAAAAQAGQAMAQPVQATLPAAGASPQPAGSQGGAASGGGNAESGANNTDRAAPARTGSVSMPPAMPNVSVVQQANRAGQELAPIARLQHNSTAERLQNASGSMAQVQDTLGAHSDLPAVPVCHRKHCNVVCLVVARVHKTVILPTVALLQQCSKFEPVRTAVQMVTSSSWRQSSSMTANKSRSCRALMTLEAFLTLARFSLAAAARSMTCAAAAASRRAPICRYRRHTPLCCNAITLPRKMCPVRKVARKASPSVALATKVEVCAWRLRFCV